MSVYELVLVCLLALCAAAVYVSGFARDAFSKAKTSDEFLSFQRSFLAVYILAMAGDWLQGAYVYTLYSHYGYNKGEIGVLFVIGFLASAVLGTLVAGLADQVGRKKMCIAYCILYIASCLTKHSANWYSLVLGRILGGTATSILYSAFETWMVHEHKSRGFAEEWLSMTFSTMMFSNGLVAIVCGIVANGASNSFGFVAPFDVAILCLTAAIMYMTSKWNENFGQKSANASTNFVDAFKIMKADPKIWLLALIQSCFEGTMYIFVFSWTPILEESDPHIPHGTIFAYFMIALMIGSSFFTFQSARGAAPSKLILVGFIASTLGLSVPILTENLWARLGGFLLFESSVGIYFPCIGMLRGKAIPDHVRATTMNFFRIPLNALVTIVLLRVGDMAVTTIAAWWAFLMFSATGMQIYINKLTVNPAPNKPPTSSEPSVQDVETGTLNSSSINEEKH